ncbi:hypothetical protein EI613_01190 [Azospirillum sp. 412522]|nr:hypothetical protein [Azospirillum sp. 412522]
MAAVPGPHALAESPSAMVETTACPYCGSDYGHGPNDCPLCRSARRKDLIVRCVIGLMFLVPILTLFATILLDNGVGKMLSMD